MTEGTSPSPILTWLVIAVLLACLLFWFWPRNVFAAPDVGAQAPTFSLLDQNGKTQSLEAFRGQWLVLYFYPKDDTPGCTTEACNFRDDYYKIRALNAAVIGVSLDDVASHKAFAEKYHLPFSLLADLDHKLAESYGVLSKYGPLSFASRQTFIINPEGKIARHYARVNAERHANEIISYLEQVKK
jgi:peroxiredoxin Q/BCP